MKANSLSENDISYIIRGAIFKTYNAIGPGLLESVYKAVLRFEIERAGLKVNTEVGLPILYDDVKLDIGYRIDLLIENKVIIEIKSIENLAPVHHMQLLTYLKLSTLKLGILVNFNTDNIQNSIFRKVNGL